MKKKLVAAALACFTVAALALAGCSSGGNTATNTATDSQSSSSNSTATETTSDVTDRTVYVSAEWVNDALNGKVAGYENAVIAYTDYALDAKEVDAYKKHVPGAIYVSSQEIEDATGEPSGAYNLLAAETVADNMLKHGITADTKVILYGSDICCVSRQAYAYLWCGVKDVKILDGGLDAWTAAGFDTEKDANEGTAAKEFGVTVPAHPEYWTSIDDAKSKLASDKNFKLVSIRSEGEWLGKTSGYTYMEKAGEPEGAVWGKGADTAYDVAQFVNEDGTVKDLEGFKAVWKDCDFTLENDLSFYCGTGWRATVPFLVLYQNGYDNISVYDGGWYEWLMHDDFPVQVGDPASDKCEHTTVAKLPTGKAAKE